MKFQKKEIKNDMLYSFFWVIPWHLNFMCQRFGHPVCSEMSAHKIWAVGSRPKEEYNIQITAKV
jgi:hypothetical protein